MNKFQYFVINIWDSFQISLVTDWSEQPIENNLKQQWIMMFIILVIILIFTY